MMKLGAWVLAILASLLSSAPARVDADAPGTDEPRDVPFPAAGVVLTRPDRFEVAADFMGFFQELTTSSLTVVALPVPYEELARTFTRENLATKGVRVDDRKSVEIDGRPGVLIQGTQNAYQIEFGKWMLVVGDDETTKIITATFPKAHALELSAPLKRAVLSARFTEMPPADAPVDVGFTMTPSKKLKPNLKARGVGKVLAYSRDPDSLGPEEPILIAAPSMGRIAAVDRKRFAQARLNDLGTAKATRIKSTKPIELDGLEGFEVVAEGKDTKSSKALLLYEVILFEDDGKYYLIIGSMGQSYEREYLREIEAMARSFKRTSKP